MPKEASIFGNNANTVSTTLACIIHDEHDKVAEAIFWVAERASSETQTTDEDVFPLTRYQDTLEVLLRLLQRNLFCGVR